MESEQPKTILNAQSEAKVEYGKDILEEERKCWRRILYFGDFWLCLIYFVFIILAVFIIKWMVKWSK